MLPEPSGDVACHAGVECGVFIIRENVNVVLFGHSRILSQWYCHRERAGASVAILAIEMARVLWFVRGLWWPHGQDCFVACGLLAMTMYVIASE